MVKMFSGKKGMTLIEVLISISILGIISVPLFALFTNSALVIRLNERQMRVSALTRTIKENVSKALKEGSGLPEYAGGNYDSVSKSYKAMNISLPSAVNSETDFIGVVGSNGSTEKLRDYKYRVAYLGCPDSNAPNTREYQIKIYNGRDKFIQKFIADINNLPG